MDVDENGGKTAKEYTPPATQEDLNALVEARLKSERKKYEGFDDLKAKAAQFDELQAKNQTEADRIAKLESEFAATKARAEALEQANRVAAWRSEIAKSTGIPADALRGDTKEDLEAHAKVLAEAFKTPPAPRLDKDGKNGGDPATDSKKEAVRELFGRKD